MFWKDFNFKLFSFLCIIFVLSSCTNENTSHQEVEKSKKEKSSLTEEEQIIRQVETELQISAAEEYDIQIKYEYIDPDTLKDAVILVNRKDYAHKYIKSKGTERFFEETGHTAPYNYVFVRLGKDKKLLSTTPVGSNVDYPLEIQFLDLTSKAYTDFYVDYRIRNSLQRNYYTVRNNRIYLTFSCPVYDDVGEENPKVFQIKHEPSSVRISRDIALYKAKFKNYNPKTIEDVNHYVPEEIIGNDELYVFFIFDEKSMKYKTPMKPEEKD